MIKIYREVGSRTSGLNRSRAMSTVFQGPPLFETLLAEEGFPDTDSWYTGPPSSAGYSVSVVKVPHGCPALGAENTLKWAWGGTLVREQRQKQSMRHLPGRPGACGSRKGRSQACPTSQSL